MKNAIEKIKKFLDKSKPSPFVREYLFLSNARASIYVSSLVAVLEIWMLVMMITGVIRDSGNYSIQWLLAHTIAYVSLLAISVVMLAYAILYLRGKASCRAAGTAIKILFSLAMVVFGLFVSYTSADRGGQVFAFITVIVFLNCILIWHPAISFISLAAIFFVYIYLQEKIIPITFSIKVNAFTTWLAIFAATLNTYQQKKTEARKDEKLRELNAYLEKMSLLDELTSLPNMKCFYAKAAELFADQLKDIKRLRLVFMDVENFKNYNEKYGFAAGTEFLKTVAQIVSGAFKGDLTARFSDDHFVALADADGLDAKIQKIQNDMREQDLFVQLRIKAGIYAPKKRTESPNLACDRARYACESIKKHYGRDVIEYDSSMQKEFRQKQYIINNLDKAIKKGFIKVYYQPVVDINTNKLRGFEALARWDDPEHGFLPPLDFIGILEEAHLIHKLDTFMLRKVCEKYRKETDLGHKCVPISFNLSRLDFKLCNIYKEVVRLTEEYQVPHNMLHIEITESVLDDDDGFIKSQIEKFQSDHFEVWMDDFGSGFSSLNVLKDYDFNYLKIDMLFLRNFTEKSKVIIRSIIEMAKRLNIGTLTEGVETKEHLDFLKEAGCDLVQGYYFSKPLPYAEVMKVLEEKGVGM